MAGPYPELAETVDRVRQVVAQEESTFFATIDDGLARIDRMFQEMQQQRRVVIDGQSAGELYATYGVPPELLESMAAERNLTFDWTGFRSWMEGHGQRSGKAQIELFPTGPVEALKKALHATEFLGYETVQATAEVKGIIAQNQLCDQVAEVGHERPIVLVLDRSPFYAESGGQVGDVGEIVGPGFRMHVTDTQKDGELILHQGHLVEGTAKAGTTVTARVDAARRQAIRRAHSATHILHHALQRTLGRHAQQQGSKVDDDWLRFDFTHLAAVGQEELDTVQRVVRERVADDAPVAWRTVPLAEARSAGAMMLFGEKYPDPVRMVTMGDFSKELCGGTHVERTGEIGEFEITSEEAVSSGTRRITAVTGRKARQHLERTRTALEEAAQVLGVPPAAVPATARGLADQVRQLRKQLSTGAAAGGGEPSPLPHEAAPAALDDLASKTALRETARALNVSAFDVPARLRALRSDVQQLQQQLQQRVAAGPLTAAALLSAAENMGGTRIVVAEAPAAGPGLMRQLIDQLRKTAAPCAVLLAACEGDDKVTLVAGVSQELVQRGVSAGDWVRQVAPVVGGGGGGRADMAQAGGKDPQQLPAALEKARQVMRDAL
jgi:alanyl-tRNA synthetase